jgi:hypothetical protein
MLASGYGAFNAQLCLLQSQYIDFGLGYSVHKGGVFCCRIGFAADQTS